MRQIISKAEKILDAAGYDYCDYSGCFDIAARKGKNIIFLKVLSNIDSVQEEHANNLKTIACKFGSTAMIIGEKTRREELEQNIIYSRFSVPATNISTLESMLDDEKPVIKRSRGGFFVEIDAVLLREKRQALGLTQSQLAEKTGTTKKSIYEHERENRNASKELADKMEALVGPVSSPCSISVESEVETRPRGKFEAIVSKHFKSMGFDTSLVYQAPFNIIARGNEFLLLSEAEENAERLGKIVEDIISFSKLVKKPAVAVTNSEAEMGIPTISQKELKSYSARDIKKIARNW